MSKDNVVSIRDARKKAEVEETKVDEMFADIIERNRVAKERLEKERLAKNKQIVSGLSKGRKK